MTSGWHPPAEDFEALRAWFDRWGALVAAVDFVPARDLFEATVAGFGTHRDVVQGLDRLEAEQWRRVWPTIEDFRFHSEDLVAEVAPDRLMAIGLCTWSSTGRHADGTAFPRPGRATVAFARPAVEAPWKGIHTHISLNPGTPQRSYGTRPAKS